MGCKLLPFGLGQQVVTKKLGFPGVGRVVGIVYAHFFRQMNSKCRFATWDDLYPHWGDYLIYYVSFQEPQKACTYEELRKNSSPETSDQDVRDKFNKLPELICLAYPFEDLELFDESEQVDISKLEIEGMGDK